MSLLTPLELKNLIQTVFPPLPGDHQLALLVDVPDEHVPDHPKWRQRRQLAYTWFEHLKRNKAASGLSAVNMVYYQNVHNNNADLPETAYLYSKNPAELTFEKLKLSATAISMQEVLATHQLFLAPTQFSATAPLKLQAAKCGFRAATMPGFSVQMLPALKLDYAEIARRVNQIKALLDQATAAEIQFQVTPEQKYLLKLDLRFRLGHSSSGVFPEKGTAGNLPSGESYIVPYEGEQGPPSQSEGLLPVQLIDEIVVYQIRQNRARAVVSEGAVSDSEARKLKREPAYGNLAELGFGVLATFGIQPIGEILLDEKLGLHIAFGRSDHFGGAVGVKDFSQPAAVEHTDRIYLPATQPRIQIKSVKLALPDQPPQLVMAEGEYTIF